MSKPSLRELFVTQLRSQLQQRARLRISQAGMQCVREVYYSATGVVGEPPKLENLIAMTIGTAVDAMILKGDVKDWKFQVPVSITLGSITVEGTSDAVHYNADAPDHVSDLKVVGTKTWQEIQERPKQEHFSQVNLYAYGLGVTSWSVLYLNRDTRELKEHHHNTDEFEARADFGLFEEVFYWMKRGEPPPHPYSDRDNEDGTVTAARDRFPCAWCSYKATCWPMMED